MASDQHTRFHEAWLGMVQPVEGLVVSIPVLTDAQCMVRHGPELQQTFRASCPLFDPDSDLEIDEDVTPRAKSDREALEQKKRQAHRRYRGLSEFLEAVLEWTPNLYDEGDALPENLSRYISEGQQTIRPTLALRKLEGASSVTPKDGVPDVETPESEAGKPYVALVWELPKGLPFDKPETETGDWRYPPAAKFDRLLRACRVPIGLLSNREAVRLIYAPHGEATGSITFDLTDMGEVGGRPILDAFVMLAGAYRFFGVSDDQALPALLRKSRERQANVTNTLAGQVFEALDFLVQGFEAAARRDQNASLRSLLELSAGDDPKTRLSEDDHMYRGLLTVLLRLVFLLYAEDKELLPVEHESYLRSLSLSQLFEDLRRDHGAFPDTMNRRFGAWPRLLALFRSIHDGVEHGDLHIPRRRGELFDPSRFPFLESWGLPDTAVPHLPEDMAQVGVPTIDDETVYRVLDRLMILEGQRLSYKVLDVEQIGSVYEALMGYGVMSLASGAVCCRHKSLQSKSRGGVWIEARVVLQQKPDRRSKFLVETYDVLKSDAEKIAKEIKAAKSEDEVLEALDRIGLKNVPRRQVGQLALQPGEERRRTSSHYTPRSLSQPIVRRTLEPLLMAMSDTGEPSSEQLLSLKICDPAMGSGAFLVEACRFLADHVVAAWEREGQKEKIASAKEDVVTHARRLVAQRCLYGVDKNPFAVNLAKLSLWLVTLARDEPFTFVDHCLRHGDSLVGLSFDQIKAFHWKPEAQMELIEKELASCVKESLALRQEILKLAGDASPGVTRLKEQLLWDAQDAQERARMIGDLVVGAFFEGRNDKDRQVERNRRLELVRSWLEDEADVPRELKDANARLRERISPFHWMLEFPEIFYHDRPDPLETSKVGNALVDAFVGNPPFAGKNTINDLGGQALVSWLNDMFEGAHGNSDYCAYFLRRAADLVGEHGSLGFITTSTIAQGDTRRTGLGSLLRAGLKIYEARRSMRWPGDAAVTVSVVHLAKGLVSKSAASSRLDGLPALDINSRLRPKPERDDPIRLQQNDAACSQGSIMHGTGFILTPEEARDLIAQDPRNRERIFPYIGGKEINSSPTHEYSRYCINFGSMSLSEAQRWPALIEILRDRVKPDRDRLKNNTIGRHQKQFWWRFWADRPDLYAALRERNRCLVSVFATKHVTFTFQPVDRIFSNTLWVFPIESYGSFAVLQSRIHSEWAWLLCSTYSSKSTSSADGGVEGVAGLRYAASDCFSNFPFPQSTPHVDSKSLCQIGRHLFEERASYMKKVQAGLTDVYNKMRDPDCDDTETVSLRHLHEELDRAVLAAYGWADLNVPTFKSPRTAAERSTFETFRDEVLDRLFVLNAERASEEATLGTITKPKTKTPKTKKPKRKTSSKQLELTDPNAET